MPFGRVVSATSPGGTRLPSPRGASLPRGTERVWVEGGRSQMATIWTDEAGTGIQALNSGRAGMDYVQNLSRMRPDSSPNLDDNLASAALRVRLMAPSACPWAAFKMGPGCR